jgi:hypothetical protein
MNQLVRTTLSLEQCECRRCGRFFYTNAMDKGYVFVDFHQVDHAQLLH